MGAALFARLHIYFKPPDRWELWQNQHGKCVIVEFSDNTLETFWEESLELALQQRESRPIKL